jgi:hypothetical protein
MSADREDVLANFLGITGADHEIAWGILEVHKIVKYLPKLDMKSNDWNLESSVNMFLAGASPTSTPAKRKDRQISIYLLPLILKQAREH